MNTYFSILPSEMVTEILYYINIIQDAPELSQLDPQIKKILDNKYFWVNLLTLEGLVEYVPYLDYIKDNNTWLDVYFHIYQFIDDEIKTFYDAHKILSDEYELNGFMLPLKINTDLNEIKYGHDVKYLANQIDFEHDDDPDIVMYFNIYYNKSKDEYGYSIGDMEPTDSLDKSELTNILIKLILSDYNLNEIVPLDDMDDQYQEWISSGRF